MDGRGQAGDRDVVSQTGVSPTAVSRLALIQTAVSQLPQVSRTAEFPQHVISAINANIDTIISPVGWPLWITRGEGGMMPGEVVCNLAEAKYQWGARLDFFRGQVSDDWLNTRWSSLFRALTGYREHLARFRALPESDRGNGDAVEMLVGVAYACATEGAFLPEG